ncbi:MAG: hypothetical protein JXR51_01085 [Bacteroidales bacterium]|nr:hypothetical protein [Bacteroidales bacterium]MBN2755737.1 hypothetical protein [Bacteroidales bacterium]
MKNWIIAALVVIGILIIIGVAYDYGLFDNISWEGGAIMLAALAAPYMAVKNFLFGNKHLKEFKEKYENIRTQEITHRSNLDESIKAKEKRISDLDKEIQLLDAKMDVLELKKKNVEKTVKDLSIEDTKKEALNLFGD